MSDLGQTVLYLEALARFVLIFSSASSLNRGMSGGGAKPPFAIVCVPALRRSIDTAAHDGPTDKLKHDRFKFHAAPSSSVTKRLMDRLRYFVDRD